MLMNEKHSSDADIIPFIDKLTQLEKMSDGEVIHHFLTQLRHPGAPHTRHELAAHILKLTGQAGETDDPHRLAWCERIQSIAAGISFTAKPWDELIDPASDKHDPGFAALVTALQDTKGNDDLRSERAAMLSLLDLRVASLQAEQYDSEQWVRLAEVLSDTTNPVQSNDNDKS